VRCFLFVFNFSKKLFWILASLLVFFNALASIYLYKQTQSLIYERANEKTTLLQNYFVSMRYVYHQQFLKSGLEIDDKSVGFLPAHASTFISDHFSEKMDDGTTIRNVSDQARNKKNSADRFEKASIRYFIEHPEQSNKVELIEQNSKRYYFYTSPLYTQSYCLTCHGAKEEVLEYVRNKYDSAYGYKEGEIRGVTSIKIPFDALAKDSMRLFYANLLFSWSGVLLLLLLLYFVIRALTRKEAEAKIMLEKEVHEKTASLKESNRQLEHLFSILRTVADCNQVLITASSLDELIHETAGIIFKNSAFAGVKILIYEEGHLRVKISLGLDEEYDVLPLEADTFENNKELIIDSFDASLSHECLEKANKHNIKALYAMPLIHRVDATEALGLISICTKIENGFTEEEKDMIRELAGDIGFAINSYQQKKQIEQLSFYSSLTHLPNKHLLLSTLEKRVSLKDQRHTALLYMDVDNFKMINDLMGISTGDILLQELSLRFASILDVGEDIYHLGGDEFVMLIENLSSSIEKTTLHTQKRAEALLKILLEPFIIQSQKLYVTLSIGIAFSKDQQMSANELINSAESALILSKKAGKNSIRFYDTESQKVAIKRSSLLQELRIALEEQQFFMLYQKQINSHNKVLGYEALVRWGHPLKGAVSPMDFIPLAEESGLIIELGTWVFKESLRQLALWREDPQKLLWKISINVSPLQFYDEAFVSLVDSIVQNAGVPHSAVRIELTEGIFIHDIESVSKKLTALKKLGFSLSIDDFGTGYSSLSYLKNLPIDELKIDQSFIRGLKDGSADQTIVEAIVAMGKAFSFEVIAEGVETQEQLETLKALGCEHFQGYLFAKPLKAEEIE